MRVSDGSWQTHSLRNRLLKTCIVLAIIIFLYQYLPREHDIDYSMKTSSVQTIIPQKEQCSKPYDAAKPLIQYTVMIDAGSTGSRVHVYKFNNCGPTPELEKEYFKMTEKRPGGSGLSSFTDVEEAARSLDPLVLFAQSSVPEDFQSCTPIAVKATAGLRLLGEELSQSILDAVRTRLETHAPFAVVSREIGGVEIMKGEDEAVFAWITTNYLLGRLGGSDGMQPAAIIDLGGGSSQIVFQPNLDQGIGGAEAQTMKGNSLSALKFDGKEFQLYRHSHLGYGLMSARKALYQLALERIYQQEGPSKSWSTQCIPNPCLPPGSQLKVTVEMPSEHDLADEHDTIMEGPVDAHPAKCRLLTKALLENEKICIKSPCSLNGVYQPSIAETFSGDIYIFSYFYDRTHDLGMPDTFMLHELSELISKVCAGEKSWSAFFGHVEGAVQSLEETPEWCLDLNFMLSLLHDGYGIPLSRKVKIANKIRGNEIGWCLGASLPLLDRNSGWQCRPMV